jgi:hypothetical protein
MAVAGRSARAADLFVTDLNDVDLTNIYLYSQKAMWIV